ncbi:hypothetical protein AVEN_115181-1 [Araneus ventricosus]|uniref:Reverse transcriptase zinc-binding domain-containing protein n=1 Tax=Araneus ventricosus TaxID=182803 RepID=A0A4Y1ZXI6_ARAVE|nr:hypothetical protein AVEN_115181-1 [Araneus ventricosus]
MDVVIFCVKATQEDGLPVSYESIFAGHGIFQTYQNKFFGKSEKCNCGADKRDAKHLLLECGLWKHEREALRLDWKAPLKIHLLHPSFQNFSRIVPHKLLTLEFWNV